VAVGGKAVAVGVLSGAAVAIAVAAGAGVATADATGAVGSANNNGRNWSL